MRVYLFCSKDLNIYTKSHILHAPLLEPPSPPLPTYLFFFNYIDFGLFAGIIISISQSFNMKQIWRFFMKIHYSVVQYGAMYCAKSYI